MIQISAVIITFNEERNISRCLDSVKDVADEIFVLDSFSTDRTAELCKRNGVRFEQHAFEGYIEQKNRAADMASHHFLLSLDADEALSSELKDAIMKIKNNPVCDGYEMNRLTNYCGKWIRHSGWYPDKKLRLFDRRKGKWGGMNPHDKYEMQEGVSIGFLEGDLLHYSYYTVSQHRIQALRFSELAAKALFAKGKKSSLLKMMYKPAARFIKAFFLQLGFLDGGAGLTIAYISASASYKRYKLLYNLQKQSKNNL